ncbi:MAG: phage tail tape measure protein, partial [Candidatus Freyarchaeota archaeon]
MNGFGGFLAGAIVGKMILDRTQWAQSVSKVKQDEKTLSGAASRMGSGFAKAGRAMTLAGGAIVGTLGMMVKSYVKAGDEVHKMALRTGFATETLSELRYAAQISGTDLTSLEKAVKKMQKTIVDASEGMTTYQRAFERIGVNYKELQGLHPEQQFEILARAIASVEDPTIRAATAQDVFGRAGTKLLPLFAQGVDGMEALREKARELGMVFDQEAADKAARLADAQATLKGAMQGLTIAIAENIVPVLSKFVEGLSGVISKISDWMKANPFLASTITKVVAVLGGLMTMLGPMLIILPKLVAGMAMMKGAVVALAGPVGILTAALGALAIGYLKVRDAQKKAQEAAERAAQQEDMLFAKMKKAADMAGLTEQEFLKLRDAYNGNAAAMAMAIKRGQEGKKLQEALAKVGKEHAEEIEKQKDATEDYKSAIENALKPMEELKQKQQSWLDYLKETGIQTLQQKQDRVEELTNIIADLDKALKDGKISEEDYTEAITKAREEIELLEGATTTWGKVLEDFGIKTVSQAKQETEYLKSAFSLLQEKLKSGELTQEEYNKAVEELETRLKAATDEVVIMGGQLAVLGQQFDALVPKARNFGDIAADMMPPAT